MLSQNIKQKITSSYALNKGDIELEARFGIFKKGYFNPGVTRQVFNRIKAYFDKQSKDVNNTKTTDYIMGRVRKSIINPEGEDNAQTIWITKNRLWDVPLEEYGIRYSMSSEIPIEPIANNNFIPEMIREKNRSSYFVFGKAVRIDITLVTSNNLKQETNIGNQNISERNIGAKAHEKISYEVEIELIEKSKLTEFEKAIGVVLRLVLDTIVLYNESLKHKVINEINSILGSTKRGILDHYPLVQARNLKLRDMVYGGLVGNENTMYNCTHKADGVRKMLVFLDSGIWLASSPNSLTRVTEAAVPTLTGTIIDGEMIPVEKRLDGAPKSRIWYLAFDALAWNRDNSIQKLPHVKRMFHAQSVADLIKGDVITVNTKTFKNISTPQEFFKIMREMFREQLLLTYKQDGFMFTPQNTQYNPHSDSHPLYSRVLTKYPDICKWKPKEELTIDFLIKWRADVTSPIGRDLELYVNFKGEPSLFKQSANNVDILNELTLNLPNNTVVEYRYDYSTKLLTPVRIRHDKDKPNKLDIAEDVWSDIMTPIDKTTMEGNDFNLLRRYHNRIKRELFNSVSGNNNKGRYLLDIGSGRGGDINKWKGFDKIVAVEPNREHIEELKRRLDEATGDLKDLKNRVFILQSGGEETDRITDAVNNWIGDKVDVVSSMLSLTFFWQNSALVGALCNTITSNIKPGGKFIFLTMDGDLVEQTFEPAFGTGLVLNKLEFGGMLDSEGKSNPIAVLNYDGNKNPKELHIHIKDSIVTDQTEWLVRLNDLIARMKGFNFTMKRKADEEKFLTEEEITMTQMYTYGILEHDGVTPLGLIEVKDIENVVVKPVSPVVMESLVSTPVMSIPNKEEIIKKKKEIVVPAQVTSIKSPVPVKSLPPLPTTLPFIKKIDIQPIEEIRSPALETKQKVPTTSVPSGETIEDELPMLKMNVVEKINVSWTDESVVRIGAVGDGSCFFHSVLNAYLKLYQINPDVKFRKKFVRNLRKDISLTLALPDPIDVSKTRYETAANGQFANLYAEQLLGLKFQDVFGQPVDFSIEGLRKLFDSDNNVGDEIYAYIADLLDIDVYVMRLTSKDLYIHLNTYQPGRERRSVIISGNGYHFETIGVVRNSEGLYQTFFESNDPFIEKIRSFSK